MIDSKKLAATPITEFDPRSKEYLMALVCHYDRGTAAVQLAMLVKKPLETIVRQIEEGRALRDIAIRDAAAKALTDIEAGKAAAPRIVRKPAKPYGGTFTPEIQERALGQSQGQGIRVADLSALGGITPVMPSQGSSTVH